MSTTGPQRRYRVLALVGSGGFGRVYRARMEGAQDFTKDVALKLLDRQEVGEEELARFHDEARILGLVRDRAIIQVDPPTLLDGRWAVILEYVDGVSLAGLLRQHGPMPPTVALEIVQEVARALDAAWHHTGPDGDPLRLVHRDIKPGNLQLTPGGQVKILDFGIARAEWAGRQSLTTRHVSGTPAYLAPERLQGHDGPEGDVYSLGVVLHELVRGRLPTADAPETLDFDLDAAPSPVDPVGDLALEMRSPGHTERPSAREVEARCEALRKQISGPSLRDWAAAHVPEADTFPPDELVGRVLEEEQPGPAPQPRWPWMPILALAGVLALLLSTALVGALFLRPTPQAPAEVREWELTGYPIGQEIHSTALDATGEQVAWTTRGQLWVRQVDALSPAVRLEGPDSGQLLVAGWLDEQRVLVAGCDPSRCSLWEASSAGHRAVEATLPTPARAGFLTLSPDATRVAVATSLGAVVVSLDTGQERLVFPVGGSAVVRAVAWSPDSTTLAVATNWPDTPDRSAAIDLVPLDGGDPRRVLTDPRLTDSRGNAQALTWRDDETLLLTLYESDIRSGRVAELHALRVSDGHLGPTLHAWPGVLAYGLRSRGDYVLVYLTRSPFDVLLVQIAEDGSLSRPEPLGRSDWRDITSGWLPNGQVLFTSNRSGSKGVWAQRPGEEPHALVDGPGDEYAGSATDTHLVFVSAREDGAMLVSTTLSGAETTDLAPIPDHPVVRCGGSRCVIAEREPQGTRLRLLDPGAGSLEELRWVDRAAGTLVDLDLSADGEHLAWLQTPTNESASEELVSSVEILDLDDGERHSTYLPRGSMRYQTLGWQSHGQGFLLTGIEPEIRGILLSVDLEGRITSRIQEPEVKWYYPYASPDGRSVALTGHALDGDLVAVEGL